VPATVERIRSELGFEVYRDSMSHEFAAVGDEDGLLIVVRKGRTWFGTSSLAAAAFSTRVEFAGGTGRSLQIERGYAITA